MRRGSAARPPSRVVFCEYDGKRVQRQRWKNGRLETYSLYLRRRFCSEECARKARLHYEKPGLPSSPSDMMDVVNGFIRNARKAVRELLDQASKIDSSNPKEADRIARVAVALNRSLIALVTQDHTRAATAGYDPSGPEARDPFIPPLD